MDGTGRAWWIAVCAAVGGIVGGMAKVLSNLTTGEPRNEGVIGAIAGGAMFGGLISYNGNLATASYASAAAESFVNEACSYIPKAAEWNGSELQPLNIGNFYDSCIRVIDDTLINGTTTYLTGRLAQWAMPINNGWFKPQKLTSCLVGSYALRSHTQTILQGFGMYIFEQIKKPIESLFDWSNFSVRSSIGVPR
jgi:hypothetical protein